MPVVSQNHKYRAIFGLILVTLIFVAISYLTREYEDTIRHIIGKEKIWGMTMYTLISAVSVVIAPVSTLPLIPLASTMWGWIPTGILSVIGWLLGAEIAFLLARYLGKPFIQKFISIEKLERLEREVPEHHLFLTVVFLRMFVSVDLLSYALGLFSNMKNISYILATLIGITPFAFIFAYTGTLSLLYQIEILTLASLITVIWFIFRKKIYNNN